METKAKNNKTTFMECLVGTIMLYDPYAQQTLLFYHELVHLELASKSKEEFKEKYQKYKGKKRDLILFFSFLGNPSST
jgi:hypothetical protein